MNSLVLNNVTGEPDKAANEPYEVVLHNGGKAKVRNYTVADMLGELRKELESELASGDPRIEKAALRLLLVVRAVTGELDNPVEGYHDILETNAALSGETREQYLARQLMEMQAANRRLQLQIEQRQDSSTDAKRAYDSAQDAAN